MIKVRFVLIALQLITPYTQVEKKLEDIDENI